MTVKQLKQELGKYPDNMDVFVAERKTEYKYGLYLVLFPALKKIQKNGQCVILI
jgi:hypothetical protein